MKKIYLLLLLFLITCNNHVNQSGGELLKVKCLDGISHYEYFFIDELAIHYYFYVPRFDKETKQVKTCF